MTILSIPLLATATGGTPSRSDPGPALLPMRQATVQMTALGRPAAGASGLARNPSYAAKGGTTSSGAAVVVATRPSLLAELGWAASPCSLEEAPCRRRACDRLLIVTDTSVRKRLIYTEMLGIA